MATSKLIKPTNVTVQIPAFTDQPDQRVNSNCIDKSIDGINTLSDQIGNLQQNAVVLNNTKTEVTSGATMALSQSANNFAYLVVRLSSNSSDTSSARGIIMIPMVGADLSAYYPVSVGGSNGNIRASISGTSFTIHSESGFSALYSIGIYGCIKIG